MRILVTGASGLLGNAVAEAAVEAGHQVIAVSNTNPATVIGVARAELIEGTDGDAFTGLCCGLRPAVIINCAALSNPASVDERPEEAQAINVAMPGMLAGLAYELDARFLHISTDMVFDGLAEHPYGAGDATNPSNLYGQTKLDSEDEVLETYPAGSAVLRIPILMGNSPGGGRSLHEKLLGAIRDGGRPKLFTDEIRQPCSVTNVASVLLELAVRRELTGVFHWAGADRMSRYDIGLAIVRKFGLPEDSVEAVSLRDDPAFARRPARLTFDTGPLEAALETRPAGFAEQLAELRAI